MDHKVHGVLLPCLWYCIFHLLYIASGANMLQNPSFEEVPENPWLLRQRYSAWKYEKSQDLQITTEQHNTGKRSLVFRRFGGGKQTGLVASQYINMESVASVFTIGTSLNLGAWFGGDQSDVSKVRLLADIVFNDTSVFFVDFQINDTFHSEDNKLQNICTRIPISGKIRAIMVHIVLESPTEKDIYVDDVSVAPSSDKSEECLPYTASHPIRRKVLVDHLSPTRENMEPSISFATQLTKDRLPRLADNVKVWKGPISAAILLFCSPNDCEEDLKLVSDWYNSNELNKQFIRMHVVFHDIDNLKDERYYPANFLRNVALANVQTSHVFYVDCDIIPNLSERSLFEIIKTNEDSLNAPDKYAFIVPVFNLKVRMNQFQVPTNKEQALEALKNSPKTFEPYYGVSHGAVQYGKWNTATEPYEIGYRLNMEPYFVVHSDAPMMNSMFTGYGRDKCSYSKELNAAGFKFIVLHEPFLINRVDTGLQNILWRNRGMDLRLFLNEDFHEKDLEHGYYNQPINYRQREETLSGSCHSQQSCSSETLSQQIYSAQSNHLPDTVLSVPGESQNCDGIEKAHICETAILYQADLLHNGKNERIHLVPQGRHDLLLDRIMQFFKVFTYIELPCSFIHGTTNIMLPMMHADAAISINPNSAKLENRTDGIYIRYSLPGNISDSLRTVLQIHNTPSIISLRKHTIKDKVSSTLQDVVTVMGEKDIMIYDELISDTDEIWKALCGLTPARRIYHVAGFTVIKAVQYDINKLIIPSPPDLYKLTEPPTCHDKPPSTDIIVFSKDRPLQILAFLESLLGKVSGFTTIWVLKLATSDEVEKGYETAFACFRNMCDETSCNSSLNVVSEDGQGFGKTLFALLEQLTADYVVVCVDEMVWLNPVNLTLLGCLLQKGEGNIASFQLRLGDNYKQSHQDNYHDERFHPLAFDESIMLFYPRYMKKDIGYITNVDGTMMHREELIKDWIEMSKKLSQPLSLENKWVHDFLHIRSRQWHMMYSESRFVNNLLSDGQVVKKRHTTEETLELLSKMNNDKQKLDIEHFIDSYSHKVTRAHHKWPVQYTDLTCLPPTG